MNRLSTRILAAAIVLALVLSLAACSGSQPDTAGNEPATPATTTGSNATTEQPKDDLVFRYSRGVEFTSLSTYGDSSTPGYDFWRNVMEPLVDYDWDKMEYVPALATSWDFEQDGKVWVFHLRKGVKFHDGSELTSADVVYSFKRMRDDEDSLQAEAWLDVEDIKARDDYTVEFDLKIPRPNLLSQLYNRYICSKAAFDKYGKDEINRHPIGTGPYKFVEWERGSYVSLTRFDDYWNKDLPLQIKDIVYRPIPEKSTAIAALEAGEVDLIDNVPPHEVDRLNNEDGLRIESAPSGRLMFFILNPGQKPLDDVRVRKAIQYSLDIDLIIDTVLEGRAYREWQPVPQGAYGFNPDLTPYEYDPEKAKSLLAEAGYPDGVDVEFWTPKGRYTGDFETSQAAAAMMQKAGIRAELKSPEWGIFVDSFSKGEIPIYLIGRGGFLNDPPRYLSQYFETGVTSRVLYSNPQVDQLLDASRSQMDESKRKQEVLEAEKLIHEDAVEVPLYRLQDNYGVRDWVDWTATPSENVNAYRVKSK